MQILEQDFVEYLTIKKKLAPKTVDSYRIRFLVVRRWLIENNVELTKHTFEKFLYRLKEKKLSNAALNTYIQTIKHLDGFCKDRDLPTGFSDGIENMPKTQSEINPLTPDEVERLINTHNEYKNRNGVECNDLDKKYLSLTAFIAITGCRFDEAASLKVKRLDVEGGRALLVNTKNKRNRYIFFNGEIKSVLRELVNGKSDEDLVFTNSKCQHMHAGDFNTDLRTRAGKAGITKRVHAHLLRHSFATQLYKNTHDITLVATILGHQDIKTTNDTYVHLDTEYLQKAVQRHPLMRKYVEPEEIILEFREMIENFHFEKDSRFKYIVSQSEGKLSFELVLKQK